MKRLMYWLLLGTREARTRMRIIKNIREKQSNINQLAESLGMDYKTIRHHIKMLSDNGLIISDGSGFGTVYFLSTEMESNYKYFRDQYLLNDRSKKTIK